MIAMNAFEDYKAQVRSRASIVKLILERKFDEAATIYTNIVSSLDEPNACFFYDEIIHSLGIFLRAPNFSRADQIEIFDVAIDVLPETRNRKIAKIRFAIGRLLGTSGTQRHELLDVLGQITPDELARLPKYEQEIYEMLQLNVALRMGDIDLLNQMMTN